MLAHPVLIPMSNTHQRKDNDEDSAGQVFYDWKGNKPLSLKELLIQKFKLGLIRFFIYVG